jgi:synaptic vesicle membrane protein VAT-1
VIDVARVGANRRSKPCGRFGSPKPVHGRFYKSRKRPIPNPKPARYGFALKQAASINFADILGRLGLYPDLPPIPCVPGYEVSGRVDAVGAGVEANWAGRDVFALTRFGG